MTGSELDFGTQGDNVTNFGTILYIDFGETKKDSMVDGSLNEQWDLRCRKQDLAMSARGQGLQTYSASQGNSLETLAVAKSDAALERGYLIAI